MPNILERILASNAEVIAKNSDTASAVVRTVSGGGVADEAGKALGILDRIKLGMVEKGYRGPGAERLVASIQGGGAPQTSANAAAAAAQDVQPTAADALALIGAETDGVDRRAMLAGGIDMATQLNALRAADGMEPKLAGALLGSGVTEQEIVESVATSVAKVHTEKAVAAGAVTSQEQATQLMQSIRTQALDNMARIHAARLAPPPA